MSEEDVKICDALIVALDDIKDECEHHIVAHGLGFGHEAIGNCLKIAKDVLGTIKRKDRNESSRIEKIASNTVQR